jgi:hypothetical protein
VDFDKILYGVDGIEDDVDSILSSPVASIFPKWWRFKFLRWVKRKSLVTFEPIGGFG